MRLLQCSLEEPFRRRLPELPRALFHNSYLGVKALEVRKESTCKRFPRVRHYKTIHGDMHDKLALLLSQRTTSLYSVVIKDTKHPGIGQNEEALSWHLPNEGFQIGLATGVDTFSYKPRVWRKALSMLAIRHFQYLS